MTEIIDFSKITACGECCTDCEKKDKEICKGCIETDGHCEEWKGSGACPIHKCAREHNVQFCGLCPEFPCDWLVEKVHWKSNIAEELSRLAELYQKSN